MGERCLFGIILASILAFSPGQSAAQFRAGSLERGSDVRTFPARGVVRELGAGRKTVTVEHGAITNYMDAMTMPFKVKQPEELADLRAGDEISFRLSVTETESWIDHIVKKGATAEARTKSPSSQPSSDQPVRPRHPLLEYRFTNELSQAVSLSDFRGQALAITFFFTRCPIPDYCPRLSKNFQEASLKLLSLPHAPTNWHFLSVSFDTEFDTVPVLKAYAERHQYDPKHWSFWTGPADKIAELASLSDVKFDKEGGLFNHNFRTLIIDAAGHLQMTYPIGGNLSDSIVEEIFKAAAVKTP